MVIAQELNSNIIYTMRTQNIVKSLSNKETKDKYYWEYPYNLDIDKPNHN